MADGQPEGGGKFLLLVLIFAMGIGGAWNYRRNLAAEQGEVRPYRSYGDADLEQLIEAYRSEVAGLEQRYESLRGQRAEEKGGVHFQDRVDDFERAQRAGTRVRATGASLSEGEAALRELEEEQRRRLAEADPLRLHLRRLLTL
jgi:hypothetical protein